MTFEALWAELEPIGRAPSGGYRRFAWTPTDAALREWFASSAAARRLAVTTDRAGNQWAWWGDPDAAPGVATGSHLDSVPDGGAFDGALGVVSAFAALDVLREQAFVPGRPIGIVNVADEEGGRFGAPCTGSRVLTGALPPDHVLALRDADGTTWGEAYRDAGGQPEDVGRDEDALRRVGVFVELHVEQGRALDRPVGLGSGIWPHGRWRAELVGEANHAGTTALEDRRDPTLDLARLVVTAREAAAEHGAVATCGRLLVEPNVINAIPSRVTASLDARAPDPVAVEHVLGDVQRVIDETGGTLVRESWTAHTSFDETLRERMAVVLGGPPVVATGAGHDAGILAQAGIPAGMLFVRNRTGISHSPAEHADPDDCVAGVTALARVLGRLAG